MKIKFLILVFALNCWQFCHGQQGMWTWVNGTSVGNQNGVYGIQGVADPNNTPPGTYEATEWTDHDGNFWMFGGSLNSNTIYADLWKYNPNNNMWTWVKGNGIANDAGDYGIMGVASPSNRPPAMSYGSASWVDSKGDLWMYGGLVVGCVRNHLWKYNIATNMWTWINGSSGCNNVAAYGILGVPSSLNTPGARSEFSASWIDENDNLWLFGGNNLNDLWRYNTATNEWTWMKGGNLPGQVNMHGIKGVPNSSNTPGSRFAFATWKDLNKKFWLFGGHNYVPGHSYNDMWQYDPLTNIWTWMSGTNIPNDAGNYGPLCSPSINNIPAAGYENRARWTDECGNFWMYSGAGAYLNDLWQFNPTTLEWAFINGQSITWLQPPVYGIRNTPAITNTPGTRTGVIGWRSTTGELYLFGGIVNVTDRNNDMWRFVPDTACMGCKSNFYPEVYFASSDTVLCEKSCINFTDLSLNNPTQWQWHFNGGNPNSSTIQNPTNICFNAYGDFAITLVATNAIGTDSAVYNSFIHVVQSPPQPVITINSDTLFSSPAVTYQWYFNNVLIPGATLPYYVVQAPGNYYVIATDTNGCGNNSIQVIINSVNISEEQNSGIHIYPNPANDEIEILFDAKINTSSILIIYDPIGKKVFEKTITNTNRLNIDVAKFENGLYILELNDKSNIIHTTFLVQH